MITISFATRSRACCRKYRTSRSQEWPGIRETLPLLESAAPDIVLADLSLGDGSSTELVRTLRRLRLKARVIIITGFSDEFAVVEALSAGVSGYVIKSQPTTELLEAIRSVAAGRRYVPPSLEARLALRPVPMGDETQIAGPVGLERLSPREVGSSAWWSPDHRARRSRGGCASASRPSRPTAPT